jgi:hypothetical protein
MARSGKGTVRQGEARKSRDRQWSRAFCGRQWLGTAGTGLAGYGFGLVGSGEARKARARTGKAWNPPIGRKIGRWHPGCGGAWIGVAR